ncbi:MAG TPA: hypothetical protein VE991_10295 [Acidimicrobiales bacterium]|nr:hypothetical protein [Acidimicrobiales bacterium]
MGVARQIVARALVALALVAGSAALGTWWISLLAGRASSTLSTAVRHTAANDIQSQLDRLSPGAGTSAGAQQAIGKALGDPQVAQALAGQDPGAGQALSAELGKLDPGIASVLGGQGLNLDVGEHTLAKLGRTLHHDAGFLALGALALALGALALAVDRHRIVRRLALGAALECGVAVAAAWLVPTVVGHMVHGTMRQTALDIVSGGAPVRAVLVEVLAGAAALYGASVAVQVFGRSRIPAGASVTPLAPGRAA